MPRIVNRYSNVIVIGAGNVPASGAAFWYSGKGDGLGDPGVAADPGGVGGAAGDGKGRVVAGEHVDEHQLALTIDHWGSLTALEVIVEASDLATASADPAVDFAGVDQQIVDADAAHLDVKPLKFAIAKTDYPTDGQIVLIRAGVIARKVRWGVRAKAGTSTAAQLHADHVTARRID